MGIRNYLVEGVSGTGKTSVGEELERRGYDVVHGDRVLAYQGDPETGTPLAGRGHEHHVWDVEQVRAVVADRSAAVTFFCGGSRNFATFIDLFDGVFVLEVDAETLRRRLAARPDSEWGGGVPVDPEVVVRLLRTGEDVPAAGDRVDATAPLGEVVDDLLRRVGSG